MSGAEETTLVLAPAPGGDEPSGEDLLRRHRPYLLWDSQDDYRPLSIRSILENPGNLLKRGERVLAGARGEGGRRLSVKLLNGEASLEPSPRHRLVEAPAPLSSSQRFQRKAAYANRIYGRCQEETEAIWLQYWLWLYYNPKSLLGFGRHQGDWEMVQLKLAPKTHEPLAVTYAQHGRGECKEGEDLVDEVEWRSCEEGCVEGCSHPVVYVAPFSHASYFEPGTHFHFPVTDNPDGAFFEGLPTVEPFGAWRDWKGHWGASNELLSTSPASPGRQEKQWDQAVFQKRARRKKPREERLLWRLGKRTYPATPAVESAILRADTATIRWRLTPAIWLRRGRWLLLTVQTDEERPRPIAKRTVRVSGATGEAAIPIAARPLPQMTVKASAFNLIRQRSDTSAPREVTCEQPIPTGAPRARDEWSPRIWSRLSRKLLGSLVNPGAASLAELERRRIEILGLAFDRTELVALLEHARRTGLIEPLGQAQRADGSAIGSVEWAATERGRLKVRDPLSWVSKGIGAAIPSGLIILAATFLLEHVSNVSPSDVLLIGTFVLVGVEVVIVLILFAYRYAGGASHRQIAMHWSRHAVELPLLNRWYASQATLALRSIAAAGFLLIVVSFATGSSTKLISAGYLLSLVAYLFLRGQMEKRGRLEAEAGISRPE